MKNSKMHLEQFFVWFLEDGGIQFLEERIKKLFERCILTQWTELHKYYTRMQRHACLYVSTRQMWKKIFQGNNLYINI